MVVCCVTDFLCEIHTHQNGKGERNVCATFTRHSRRYSCTHPAGGIFWIRCFSLESSCSWDEGSGARAAPAVRGAALGRPGRGRGGRVGRSRSEKGQSDICTPAQESSRSRHHLGGKSSCRKRGNQANAPLLLLYRNFEVFTHSSQRSAQSPKEKWRKWHPYF